MPASGLTVSLWDRVTGASSSRERPAGRIAEHLTSADEVWLPAAIGRHPDHVLARDAGLRAAAAVGHDDVVLYADFPYVISYGWPSWLSRQPADPYLNPEIWLADLQQASIVVAGPRYPEPVRGLC